MQTNVASDIPAKDTKQCLDVMTFFLELELISDLMYEVTWPTPKINLIVEMVPNCAIEMPTKNQYHILLFN